MLEWYRNRTKYDEGIIMIMVGNGRYNGTRIELNMIMVGNGRYNGMGMELNMITKYYRMMNES